MTILTIEEIKEKLMPIAKKYEFNQIWLFGSYARGEARENSDVDLLVDISGSKYENRMEDFIEIFEIFEFALGKPVDVITIQSLDNKKKQNRMAHFIEQVEDERRLIVA